MPRLRRIGVRFGKPLDLSRYYGMAEDRFVLRSVTDEIMYDLMQLSGQRYSDIYAAAAKKQLREDHGRIPEQSDGTHPDDRAEQQA